MNSFAGVSAIILAAGEGTRMKSAKPKVLHEILGVPMINHVLGTLKTLGRISTVLVTGFSSDVIDREVRTSFADMDISFAHQDRRLGTGHAVGVGLKRVPEKSDHALVLMGDMPLVSSASMRKLLETHSRTKSVITVATALVESPAGYGRVIRSFAGKVIGIKEDHECTETERSIKEINTGVYCFSIPFLKAYIPRIQNNNAKKEYYLTDLIHMAAASPEGSITGLRIPFEEAGGINDRLHVAEAEKVLLRRHQERLMQSGVSVVMPETVYMESNVKIAPDTVIEPSVSLKGRTAVGRNCLIGKGSILRDALIEDNVVLGPYSLISGATVRAGSTLEPFTKLKGAPARQQPEKKPDEKETSPAARTRAEAAAGADKAAEKKATTQRKTGRRRRRKKS
jgi:bifunctional UDP-N-acetylglucosamine pyrophosphorylase/glucosamine-1-phosphate N-acetyltransferase